MHRPPRLLLPVVALALVVGACGDDDGGNDTAAGDTTTTTTTATAAGATSTDGDEAAADATTTTAAEGCTNDETGPLTVVLVNDDGVVNPAIDVLVEQLTGGGLVDAELDITVVAPAEERSGTSDSTTPEGAPFTESETAGGNPAFAVDGFPADAVLVALDELGLQPHLVLSGINPGQNFGAFAPLSGTIGAARTAIRRGVPALAVSAGPELDEAQFAHGAELAADWIDEHCEALLDRSFPTDTLASINVPACAPEDMGPLQEVPRALELPVLAEGESIFASTCDLADPAPADDVAAVRSGYPSLTQVEPEL